MLAVNSIHRLNITPYISLKLLHTICSQKLNQTNRFCEDKLGVFLWLSNLASGWIAETDPPSSAPPSLFQTAVCPNQGCIWWSQKVFDQNLKCFYKKILNFDDVHFTKLLDIFSLNWADPISANQNWIKQKLPLDPLCDLWIRFQRSSKFIFNWILSLNIKI